MNRSNGIAAASFVCGIMAICLNLFIITSFLGIPLSIIAFVLGVVSYRQHKYGRAGIVLSLLSFFIVVAYAASYLAIVIADPLL